MATFSCVQTVALRLCALAANAAFIAYGASAGLWPVLALHTALLPINLMRLLQSRSLATVGCDPTEARAPGCGAARLLAATKE